MRKLASDARARALIASAPARRLFARAAGNRFAGVGVLLGFALLSISTDAASRFGAIPFALLVAVYLRLPRQSRGAS